MFGWGITTWCLMNLPIMCILQGKGLCRAWPLTTLYRQWVCMVILGQKKLDSSMDYYTYLADVRSPFSPPPLTPVTGVPAEKSNFNQWHRSIDFLTLRSGNKTSLHDANVLSVTQFTKQQVQWIMHAGISADDLFCLFISCTCCSMLLMK